MASSGVGRVPEVRDQWGAGMTDPDLKELDDLLPPDLVAMIEENRELFRALYTGIPDVVYRVCH